MTTFRLAVPLAMILAAFAIAHSSELASVTQYLSRPNDWDTDYQRDVELDKQLEARKQLILRRIQIKDALVKQLVAGRLTLAEVTEQFLRLNQDYPGHIQLIRANYAGTTDEERTAHNVLSFASHELRALPAIRRAAITACLKSQLEAIAPRTQPSTK